MIAQNYIKVIPQETGKTPSGLILPSAYEPGEHQPLCGTVLEVPEKLVYYGWDIQEKKKEWGGDVPDGVKQEMMDMNMNTLSLDTDMEVQVGDKIWFSLYAVKQAQEEGTIVGRQVYIKYDMAFCVQRGEDIIMLNGNILVKPIKVSLSDIIIAEETPANMGEVAFVGSKSRHYRNTNYNMMDGMGDVEDINVGDRVIFREFSNVPLEHMQYQTLPQKYYIMSRQDVWATITT